jgi:hypothetical protein
VLAYSKNQRHQSNINISIVVTKIDLINSFVSPSNIDIIIHIEQNIINADAHNDIGIHAITHSVIGIIIVLFDY